MFIKWLRVYEPSVKPTTLYTVTRHFELHTLLVIGDYRIDKINVDMVQELAFKITMEMAIYRTVVNYMSRILTMLKS